MPQYPNFATSAGAMPTSIFARLIEKLEQFDGHVIPLNIGDTHFAPPEASRLGNLGFSPGNDPELYQYSKAHGDKVLLREVVDKLHRKNRMNFVTDHNVQITAGATNALSCAVRAVCDAGDEMLLLAPYWPLIRGIAVSAGVTPIEVTCTRETLASAGLAELIESHITPKTTCLYLSTPNNPDGKLLTHDDLRDVALVAERHNLWVISDEVYEEFVFDGLKHESVANLPGMAGRTLTAFSFSKSYALAGLRVGYLVGPDGAITAARKMVGHTIYSVPRAMQRAALAALREGDEFLSKARAAYQEARDFAISRINAPCIKPAGCTYLFLDLSKWMADDGDCSIAVLERIAEAGVLLAPGAAFGRDCGGFARLCFTAVPQDVLAEGIDRVNAVLDQISNG